MPETLDPAESTIQPEGAPAHGADPAPRSDRPISRLWQDGWIIVALAAGLLVRILALRRPPDIDEWFTLWISGRSFEALMATLALDSGPPLYYLLLRPLTISPDAILAFRLLSVALGVLAIMVVATWPRSLWSARVAALVLALHPLHVFFSARGRVYSLLALLVLLVAIHLVRWSETGRRRDLAIGLGCLVAAAYSHYYAIYLFPLPFVLALTRRDLARLKDGLIGTFAVAICFIPGFLLLRAQPSAALAWMRIENDLDRVLFTVGAFARLGFDGRQPVSPEWLAWLVHLAGPVLILVAVIAASRQPTAARYLLVALTGVAGAIAAAALGFSAYFPLRFEVVMAGPMVLFFGAALIAVPRFARLFLATLAVTIALVGSLAVLAAHQGAMTAERAAAAALRQNIPSHVPIWTSGAVYFELLGARDEDWAPRLRVFPPSREVHPGHLAEPEAIESGLDVLRRSPVPWIWVGPTGSPEGSEIRRSFPVRTLAEQNGLTTLLVDEPQGMRPRPGR